MASLKDKGLGITVFCVPGKQQRHAYSELKGTTPGTSGDPGGHFQPPGPTSCPSEWSQGVV